VKWGGRKKGTPNKGPRKYKEPRKPVAIAVAQAGISAEVVAAKAREHVMTEEEAQAITPVGALLYVMRRRLVAKDWTGVVQAANCAAPYVHARLTISDVRVQHNLANSSDDELAASILALRDKFAISQQQPALSGQVIDLVPQPDPDAVASTEGAAEGAAEPVPEHADFC
jgi:hypothetical protein